MTLSGKSSSNKEKAEDRNTVNNTADKAQEVARRSGGDSSMAEEAKKKVGG